MTLHAFAESFLAFATTLSLGLLGLALVLTVARIVKGPTLPDRVLGLDMLTSVAVGLIAAIAIDTGFTLYVDIVIALGLVGFLATVAFARYIQAKGRSSGDPVGSLPLAGDGEADGSAAETGDPE